MYALPIFDTGDRVVFWKARLRLCRDANKRWPILGYATFGKEEQIEIEDMAWQGLIELELVD